MKGTKMSKINKESSTVTEVNYQLELKNYPTTSSKIRFLTSKNISRSEISKMLNIRYQHVRNVQIIPIKKI